MEPDRTVDANKLQVGRYRDLANYVRNAWEPAIFLGIDLDLAYAEHASCHLKPWGTAMLRRSRGKGGPGPTDELDRAGLLRLQHCAGGMEVKPRRSRMG